MATKRGTAFITGASSGIGAAFARRLARDGYDLVLHGRRTELLQQLRDELMQNHGIRAEVVCAELSRSEDLHTLEAKVCSTPDLSLLVNNAGYSTLKFFHEEDVEGQDALIRVHVIAPVRLTHAAIPIMRARNDGAIINVSSVAGFLIGSGSATYCATKAYLINFTETLNLELRGAGVRVQVLCPGFTVSDFHERLGYDTKGEFFRSFMRAEDVVDVSLRDLQRGKVVSIPGLRYKLVASASRLIPRPWFYALVQNVQESRRKRGGKPGSTPTR
jgi:short-subunit dehydrogenase